MVFNTWSLCSSLTYESNYVPWRTIVSPAYDNGGDEKFTTFRHWYPYLNNQTNYNHMQDNPFEKRDLYQCDDQAFDDAVNSGDQEVRERECLRPDNSLRRLFFYFRGALSCLFFFNVVDE